MSVYSLMGSGGGAGGSGSCLKLEHMAGAQSWLCTIGRTAPTFVLVRAYSRRSGR